MILAAFWLTSCTVVVHEEKRHPRKPDVIYVPTDGVIEEINAAGKLSFEPSRRDAYEPSKRDVLMALISNPCFRPVGRQAILSQLDRLSFEPTKTEILEAISRR